MKICALILLFLFTPVFCQVTDQVITNSNVDEFVIKKITITKDKTIIDFKLEVPYDNYRFAFFNSTYITSVHDNSKKNFIKEFYKNELNTWYTLQKGEIHEFSLIFEKIPKGMNYISIIEPDDGIDNTTSWYWKNIYINNY